MNLAVRSAFLCVVLVGCQGGTPAPPPSAATSAVVPAPPKIESSAAVPADGGAPAVAAPAVVAPDIPPSSDREREVALSREASDIYDAFTNNAPELTADDATLVFSSNRDGLTQLYAADAKNPVSSAKRLLTREDRSGAFNIMPDGKTIVFLSDKGADENWSIYRMSIDGGDLTELTPGEVLNRDFPIPVRGVADQIAYSARSNQEKSGRVYLQSIAAGSQPKLVYTDSSPSFLVDVSKNGQLGLMLRVQSMSDSTLLLVDFASGTSKAIWPTHGAPENVNDARFSSDDSLIYLSTDAGGEEGDVVAIAKSDFKEKARYVERRPATASIDQIAVASRSGDHVGVLINAGNHTELRLLDAKTLKLGAKVTMQLGSGGDLQMSADGKWLLVSFSTPDRPRDLYAIDVRTGASRALRQESRPTVAKLSQVAASIRQMKSFDGTTVPINLYLPNPLPRTKKLPTLVIVHGGPSSSYQVRWSVINRFFSARGWAIVEPNVRGSTGFGRKYEQGDDYRKRMDAVRDLEEVGKWAASQPWADSDKLVVLGGSYGGYMTLMGVTHQPKLWKAGVDLFGVYNWRSFMSTTSGVIRDVFQREIGPDSDTDFLDAVSPASKIDDVVAPLFVYAGANDPRVPRSESDAIVRNLRDRKIPVEYMVANNEGHSLDHKENLVAFLARAQRFLETNLGMAEASADAPRPPKKM